MPQFRFTLRNILSAIALVALAAGVVGFCLRWPEPPGRHYFAESRLLLWLTAPLTGALLGTALGVLASCKLKCMTAGAAIACMVDYLIVAAGIIGNLF